MVARMHALIDAGALSDAAIDAAWLRTLRQLAEGGARPTEHEPPAEHLRPLEEWIADGACKRRARRRKNPACRAWLKFREN